MRHLPIILALALTACGGSRRAADNHFEAGHYHLALDEYRSIYSHHSKDPEVNYRVAISLYRLTRYKKAEKMFRRAAELRKPTAEHLSYWADCRVRERLYADAAKLYGRILDQDIKDVSAWNNLGLMQMHLGETAEAQRSFETALSHDPNHAPSLLNLGLLHERNHRDPEKAERYFRRYREVSPDGAQAGAVSDWLVDRERLHAEKAKRPAKRSVVAKPPVAPPPSDPVVAPTESPTPSPVAAPAEPAVIPPAPTPPAATPPASDPLASLGLTDPAPATPEPAPTPAPEPTPASSAEPIDPSNVTVEALQRRLDAGDYQGVLAAFPDGLDKSHPDYGRQCYVLGVAYLEARDPANARAFLEQAAKKLPDNPDVQLQLGWALSYQGQNDEARGLWRKALRTHPAEADRFRQALRSVQ